MVTRHRKKLSAPPTLCILCIYFSWIMQSYRSSLKNTTEQRRKKRVIKTTPSFRTTQSHNKPKSTFYRMAIMWCQIRWQNLHARVTAVGDFSSFHKLWKYYPHTQPSPTEIAYIIYVYIEYCNTCRSAHTTAPLSTWQRQVLRLTQDTETCSP